MGRNTLSQIIPNVCKAAGIEGRKTGHLGKVTCATTLYRINFTEQRIKEEHTGHRSFEALHKDESTCISSDQIYKVSETLNPSCSSSSVTEQKTERGADSCDDFQPPVCKKNQSLSMQMAQKSSKYKIKSMHKILKY